MPQLSYEPSKAVVQHFCFKKRLGLSKLGGMFSAIDKVVPFKLDKVGISDYRIIVNDEEWHADMDHNRMLHYSYPSYDEESDGDYSCSRWLDDYWPCGPTVMKKLSLSGLRTSLWFLRVYAPRPKEVEIDSREDTLTFFEEPLIKNCDVVRVVEFYNHFRILEVMEIMKVSNNRYLHIAFNWFRYLEAIPFVEFFIDEFRPIGTMFTFHMRDFFLLVELVEELLDRYPASFRSRDPLMDITQVYSKGITIPLSGQRELMIHSDTSSYLCQIRVLAKGHTVPLPII